MIECLARAGYFEKRKNRILTAISIICIHALLLGCTSSGIYTKADQYGPTQTAYAPPRGRGPVVILLSGIDGPYRYQYIAEDLSKLGYYAVLLNGNDIVTLNQDGANNLENAIDRAKNSSYGLARKVAVIGFSKGGYGALAIAAAMPDVVSAVVAYYPSLTRIKDYNEFAAHFMVPILVLAGVKDDYQGCCLIESMRAMDLAARAKGVSFELVEYQDAGHAFNTVNYRPHDTADAWRRTINMLSQHLPLNEEKDKGKK